MKSRVTKITVVAALLLMSSTAFSAFASLVKKEAVTAAGATYTYQYTCSNGKRGEFNLTAATDDAAAQLAQQKAKRVCEE